MIICVSGVPGSGKTLFAVEMLDTDKRFQQFPLTDKNNKPLKDDDGKQIYQNRHIYTYNLNEVTFDWTPIDEDVLKDWPNNENLKGSVIVIDEAHKVFPVKKTGSQRPDYYTEMHEHRHYDITFVLITQHPNAIDSHVRRLIETHHHFIPKPKLRGKKRSLHLTFPVLQENPNVFANKEFANKAGVVREIKELNTKYFGTYKSGSMHISDPKTPKQLIKAMAIVALPLFFIPFAVWRFYSGMVQQPVEEITESQETIDTTQYQHYQANDGFRSDYQDPSNYLPAVEIMPWSAEIYQDTLEVKSIPYVSGCMNFGPVGEQNCKCFTQQSALIHMSNDMCLKILENGIHQPFVDDSVFESNYTTENERAREDDSASSGRAAFRS